MEKNQPKTECQPMCFPGGELVMPSDIANFSAAGLPSFYDVKRDKFPRPEVYDWQEHRILVNGSQAFWLDGCVFLHESPPRKISHPPVTYRYGLPEPAYLSNYITIGVPAGTFNKMKHGLEDGLGSSLTWQAENTSGHAWIDMELPETFQLTLKSGSAIHTFDLLQAAERVKSVNMNVLGSMLVELHSQTETPAYAGAQGKAATASFTLLHAHITDESSVEPHWSDTTRIGQRSSPDLKALFSPGMG